MPRISLLLATCVALGALTACSGPLGSGRATGTPAPAPPSPVDPSVAASADAALAGDTKAICAQAERATTSFGETYIADLKLKIDAAAEGAEAARRADEKISRDVRNFSFALADMAGLTTDPALKKALTEMSTQVKAFGGDITKINAEKMSAISGRLDKACGRG
ncbi:hypothetical protein [Actinoplanes solisilvae]|uniref:hypothetical protein n=1 Tax=Actinoplanes solisilvae TaxID=2486853 RepID=UPI000FDA8B3F|nr:hypothetical protein [Actinoplanes solisilvae]